MKRTARFASHAIPLPKSLASRLAAHLHLAEGEARASGYFALIFFLLGMGFALGRGSANTLFLKRYGIAHLPEAFAIIGLSMVLASIVYAALADRVKPERVLAGMLLVLVGLLGVDWLLIVGFDFAPAYPGYFVLYEVASELLALHMSLYFASNFDALQAKRLLPLGLASLQAGVVCGGGLLAMLASELGTQHGPAAWALLALIAVVLIVRWHARQGPSFLFRTTRRGGNELRRAAEQIVQGVRFARTSSLLGYSALGIFLMVVSLYCASFASKAVFTAAFRSEEELAIVFGLLSFITGVIALLVQLFFTGKFLQRFGVRTMNLVFPVTTIAVVALLMVLPGVAAALLVMLNRHVVMPAIRNPARTLLFEALPDWMQGRARALSLGLVLPLALLAAGGLLAFVSSAQPGPAMLWPALLTALLFLLVSVRTNAAYVKSMLLTLKERLYLPELQASEFGRGGNARVLEELEAGVMHSDEQVAVAYARVLVDSVPERATDIVLRRMQTASVPTRDVLLRLIGPHLSRPQVENLGVEGADAHETSTLVELHLAIGGAETERLIARCLAAENPRLIAWGIIGAWQSEDTGLRTRGSEALDSLLGGDRETTVLPGLEALRKVRTAGYTESLYKLLEHPSPRVQRRCLEALAALEGTETRGLEPALERVYLSHDHHVRVACVRCYALLDSIPRNRLCLIALNDDHPDVVKAAVATLCQGNEDVNALLSRWLCDEAAARPRAQEVALDYLKSHGLLPHLLPVVAEHKIALAEAMAQILSILDQPGHPHGGEDARALFRIVLRERIEQSIALALSALESVEDPHRMRIVRASLRGRDRRQVARAIEALSHVRLPLVAIRVRDLLLFLSGASRTGFQVFPDVPAAMRWARQSTDAWLRQCAEFAMPVMAQAPGRP